MERQLERGGRQGPCGRGWVDGESATVGKRLSVKCLKPLDGTSFPGSLFSSFSSFTVCSTIFSCCLAHPFSLAVGWEFEWIHQQLHSTCSPSSLCQLRSPLQPPQQSASSAGSTNLTVLEMAQEAHHSTTMGQSSEISKLGSFFSRTRKSWSWSRKNCEPCPACHHISHQRRK